LLTDLTAPPRPDAAALRAAFGLTPAEARLAVQLAEGKGLNEAARTLGITRATASSQLRAVFAKTNTQRQAELVGLTTSVRLMRNRNRTLDS
jgi:DNA-binding CsgD family transcriptional regulator